METMILYGTCLDFYGFVWVLDLCKVISGSLSRVELGIHHNPSFVESWVGKTLV